MTYTLEQILEAWVDYKQPIYLGKREEIQEEELTRMALFALRADFSEEITTLSDVGLSFPEFLVLRAEQMEV